MNANEGPFKITETAISLFLRTKRVQDNKQEEIIQMVEFLTKNSTTFLFY